MMATARYHHMAQPTLHPTTKLDENLYNAYHNALLNERNLRNLPAPPTPTTPRIDSFYLDPSDCLNLIDPDRFNFGILDSDSDSDNDSTTPGLLHEKPTYPNPHSYRKPLSSLTHALESLTHQHFARENASHASLLRNRKLKKSTRHLLELGLHPSTLDDDDFDEHASREHLPRSERRAIRAAKWEKMRTGRVDVNTDENTACKYAPLLLDQPLEPLQGVDVWRAEQEVLEKEPGMKHKRERVRNQERVRAKAREFARIREGKSNGFVRLKPCLILHSKLDAAAIFAELGQPKPWGSKEVQFDDVHIASKVRWVDVEHIEELELFDDAGYTDPS